MTMFTSFARLNGRRCHLILYIIRLCDLSRPRGDYEKTCGSSQNTLQQACSSCGINMVSNSATPWMLQMCQTRRLPATASLPTKQWVVGLGSRASSSASEDFLLRPTSTERSRIVRRRRRLILLSVIGRIRSQIEQCKSAYGVAVLSV